MKKLTGISLFIFFAVVSAILTAGLVFYDNRGGNGTGNAVADQGAVLSNLAASGITVLSTAEVAKHNTNADCWIIVNNKVYNISNYASSHPGGTRNILNYCGKESTQAFDTKGGQGSPHSPSANQMLAQFYLGDLNQKLDPATVQQTIQKIQSQPLPQARGRDEDD